MRCGASPSATGMPVGETQAGKGALPFDHPQALGAIGATGTSGGESPRARRRPRHRRRLAAERLHDRVEDGVSPRRDVRFIADQRRRARRAASTRRSPLVGDARAIARRARVEALDRLARGQRRTSSVIAANSKTAWDTRGRPRLHARVTSAAASARAKSSGSSTTRTRSHRRHRLRRGQPARRSAQAVAHARRRAVSPRVRLLVHGLRDRRRPRREDGARPIATST